MEFFITRVAVEFGDSGYARMRRKWFCAKLTAVRQGDTMWAMLRPEKYGKQAYGGQLCRKMHTYTVDNAIYVNEWGT